MLEHRKDTHSYDISISELKDIDELITEKIKRGSSIYVVFQSHLEINRLANLRALNSHILTLILENLREDNLHII